MTTQTYNFYKTKQLFEHLFYNFFKTFHIALKPNDIERCKQLNNYIDEKIKRFPVATIARETGESKGNISSYKNGKKPIPDNFLKTLYSKFGEPDKAQSKTIEENQEGETNVDNLKKALADQAAANKIQALANKENAEAINKLASAIEKMTLNFGTILNSQDAGFGLVAELVNRQVHNDAKGNEEKVKSDLDEIAQKIGPSLGPIAKKGIGADGRSEDMKSS